MRTDEPDRRLYDGAVLLTEPAAAGPLHVATARWHSGRLLLSFEGVADRSAAELLRGVLLQAEVAEDERPEDPEEFYDRQLVGLRVVTTTGEFVGEIAEVIHLPAQDLLAVRREGRPEALVPLVADIVPHVDLAAGQVIVDPPPGLFDLDLPD